jgi:hypothetical protein
MPGGVIVLVGGCLVAGAMSLYVLALYGWIRTVRATLLALVMLLVFTYWQAGRAEDMRGLGLSVTATLMILPSLVGAMAGAMLGYRHGSRRNG